MNLTVPAIVFIVTNLWGLFAGIPFTAIQPSRPLLDRAVGCLQLASTAYTLERIQPYLTPTRVVLIPGTTENSTALRTRPNLDSIRRTNATVEPVWNAATATTASQSSNSTPTGWAISNTVDFPALLSIWSTSFSEWFALLSEWLVSPLTKPPKPETPHDTTQDNLVLILLVVILSVLVKQVFQHPDSVRETALLREEVRGVKNGFAKLRDSITTLAILVERYNQSMVFGQEVQQTAVREARGHIDRIEHGISQLLRFGPGLTALRQDLASSKRDFKTAGDVVHEAIGACSDVLLSAIDNVHDVQTSLGRELQGIRENMDFMTDVRWALVQSLLQYPNDLCNQLAMAVATAVSEHLNDPATTETTDSPPNLEAGLDGVTS